MKDHQHLTRVFALTTLGSSSLAFTMFFVTGVMMRSYGDRQVENGRALVEAKKLANLAVVHPDPDEQDRTLSNL